MKPPFLKRITKLLLKPEWLYFVTYAAVTAFMTWPALTLVSRTYAERRDPLGVLWGMWWTRYAFTHHLDPGVMTFAAYPFGLRLSGFGADPLSGLLTRWLSIALGETTTYNIILLLAFFFSAVTMYFLVRYLTGSKAAAFFSGAAFAFCPYMLMHGKEHLGLTFGALFLPLFTLSLVEAVRRRTVRAAAACGAVFLIMTLVNYQYGLIGGIFGAAFVFLAWLTGKPWNRRWRGALSLRKALPVLVLVAVVAGVTLFLLLTFTHSSPEKRNSLNAAYIYSARPWDYILPHAEARFFGGLTRSFIESHLHGSFLVENSLFLGFIPMLLAVLGLAAVSFMKPGSGGTAARGVPPDGPGHPNPITSDTKRLMFSFATCGAFAFLLSMPPTAKVLGVKLYFPSYLVFKVLPQFRAFARFGLVVMLCVTVLAGYGIALLASSLSSSVRRTAVVLLLTALVLLEFAVVPPFRSLDTRSTTDYYRWLKEQQVETAVAIYPLFYGDDFYSYDYLFEQRNHQKKLLNGSKPGTKAESYRAVLMDLLHPATQGLLKRLGIQYVMVIPSLYEQGIHINYCEPVRFVPGDLPPGLKEVKSFTDCQVYEVTAAPATFIPLFASGTYQPFVDNEGRFRHPGKRKVVVKINSELVAPARCTIRFLAASPGGERFLDVSLNGRRLANAELAESSAQVEVKDAIIQPGSNVLVMATSGPKVEIDLPRMSKRVAVSVFIGNIEVEKTGD